MYNSAAKVMRLVIVTLVSGVIASCQMLPDNDQVDSSVANTANAQALQTAKTGDIDLAIEQFEKIIALDPSVHRAYTNLGLLYLKKQQLEKAEDAFKRAIEQDDRDAIAYNHLAVIQRQQGLFIEAETNYNKAIAADDSYAKAHLNLGILLDIYLQKLPEALAQYERYQSLTGGSNKDVDKWMLDIKRRIDKQVKSE